MGANLVITIKYFIMIDFIFFFLLIIQHQPENRLKYTLTCYVANGSSQDALQLKQTLVTTHQREQWHKQYELTDLHWLLDIPCLHRKHLTSMYSEIL